MGKLLMGTQEEPIYEGQWVDDLRSALAHLIPSSMHTSAGRVEEKNGAPMGMFSLGILRKIRGMELDLIFSFTSKQGVPLS